MIIKVYWSVCTAPVILLRFQWNSNFLDRFSKNIRISKVTKIRLLGAELFHADGRTDGTDRHDEANSRFSQFCECA